jgi:TolB-like protein
MGEDEVGTHARLVDARTVLEAGIGGHGGRVVGTAGDAILAEFSSVGEALAAALEAQARLAEANADLAEAQRLAFRIGINLGEVIVDGDDIFGDGVNVAARIQGLAEPGGIAVSGAVADQLRQYPGVVFDDQGPQRLKNVAEPVRVYAVRDAGHAATAKAVRPRRHWPWVAAAVLVVLVTGGVALQQGWLASGPATPEPPVEARLATGKPTIAVLPFREQGGETDGDYFADGVTEDVISELGRFSSLLVLSWSAVAPYRGDATALGELSRELDVRYVVSGTIRRADEALRVSVQLTDAARGVLLWSERYDVAMAELFAVQDAITRQVVGALAGSVSSLEQARVLERPTEDLGAYDLVLRGRAFLRNVERQANFQARSLFEAALAADPGYADAHVGLAVTEVNDIKYGWTEWPGAALGRAAAHVDAAVAGDPDNPHAHAVRAELLRLEGDLEAARRASDRAIALNPNSALSQATRGGILVFQGELQPAIDALELALRLDPHPDASWVVNLALAYYLADRYAEMIALFDRFGDAFAEEPAQHLLLAAAHGQLGEAVAATAALQRLRRVSPFFDAEVYAGNLALPAHREALLDGLAKAGLE